MQIRVTDVKLKEQNRTSFQIKNTAQTRSSLEQKTIKNLRSKRMSIALMIKKQQQKIKTKVIGRFFLNKKPRV